MYMYTYIHTFKKLFSGEQTVSQLLAIRVLNRVNQAEQEFPLNLCVYIHTHMYMHTRIYIYRLGGADGVATPRSPCAGPSFSGGRGACAQVMGADGLEVGGGCAFEAASRFAICGYVSAAAAAAPVRYHFSKVSFIGKL